MNASSSIATPVPLSSVPPGKDEIAKGRNLADELKRRSTLIGMVGPLGSAAGMVTHYHETAQNAGQFFSAIGHGNLSQMSSSLNSLAHEFTHPDGIPGVVFNSGLGLTSAVGATVGGLEIASAVRTHDKFLGAMGAIDLVGASGNVALMAGSPIGALGIGIGSAVARAGLIFSNPKEYSRVQKAQTVFSVAGAATSSMLYAGIAVTPVAIASAILGPTQILYMNVPGVQHLVDRVVDAILKHLPWKP